jgi:transcriptional regulator with XRE-family HTH domain
MQKIMRHEVTYWLPSLRSYRQLNELTIERLSQLSGVSFSTIRGLESARHPARMSTVKKLAEALNMSPHWLIEIPAPTPERVA